MPETLVWDDARIFLAVARTGSLAAAAKHLEMGIATVSRRVERLEGALGLPLFARHQSGYRLTDDGRALIAKAEALEAAALAFGAAGAVRAPVEGRVRLATAENLATHIIIPALPDLVAVHPDLTLDIVTGVATVNLHRRDADLAVRMVKPDRGHLIVRRLGTMGYGLYGAATYLAAHGDDTGGFDPDAHRFIGWSEPHVTLPQATWIETALRGRSPVLATTTLAAQVSAARAGLGLAILPHVVARAAGLTRLPIETGLEQDIWLAVHADLGASRRVRVVVDFLGALFARHRAALANP